MNETIELKLLANVPIEIGKGLAFTAPTLKQLISIGDSEYDRMISTLLINKDSSKDMSESGLTSFEIFYLNCGANAEFWTLARKGLAVLLSQEPRLGESRDEAYLSFGDDPECRLDNRNFEYFQSLILFSHHVSFAKEEYKPANAKAKALIEKLQVGKDEILRKKEQIYSLASKISGIAWKSNAVNIFNVFDLTIFQFHDALNRLEQVDHYLFTIQGIYAGNVDGKKVNLSHLHWSRKIKGD
ncbi:hypothetical protein [Cohnella boryungensis]|uniref:Uncharacterized protein n=1 Tax=Cohnella boryungensis TaxID=768479 RepID=A0ABV8S9P5_9BACL